MYGAPEDPNVQSLLLELGVLERQELQLQIDLTSWAIYDNQNRIDSLEFMSTNILGEFPLSIHATHGMLSSCFRNKLVFPLIKHIPEFARRMEPCRFAASSQKFRMFRTDASISLQSGFWWHAFTNNLFVDILRCSVLQMAR